MKNFEILSKNEMKMVLGGVDEEEIGYLIETTYIITENGRQSVCWCALASDFNWRTGACRNIDNMC